MNIPAITKATQKYLAENSPQILTGLGVAGVVSTAILTGRASFIASRMLQIRNEETRDAEFTPREQFTDDVKTVWKLYVPPVVTGTVTIACIIGANSVNTRRNAALAAAYGLTETAFREYKEKVIETVGQKAEEKVVTAIAQDKVEATPKSTTEVVFHGSKEMLCFESISGRYFHCDMETLRKAENAMNLEIINEMYVSLNDFFGKIGLAPTAIGEDLGWTTSTPLEIQYSAILDEESKPCMFLGYRRLPIPEYSNLH